MENMINIKCKTIYCNTLINKEYNEYCSLCFIHSFYVFSEYSYPIYVFINNTKNFLNNREDLIKKYNIIINQIPALSHDEYSDFCIKKLYFLIPENIKHIITIIE